jgi:hypothetical protein
MDRTDVDDPPARARATGQAAKRQALWLEMQHHLMATQPTDNFPRPLDGRAHEGDRTNNSRTTRVNACGKHDRSKSNECANVVLAVVARLRRRRDAVVGLWLCALPSEASRGGSSLAYIVVVQRTERAMIIRTAIEPHRAPCEWLWLECRTSVGDQRGDDASRRWVCAHPARPTWRAVTRYDCDECPLWEPRHEYLSAGRSGLM